MRRRLRHLFSLGREEWGLLLAACGWLALLRVALRVLPFPRIERLTVSRPSPPPRSDEILPHATRLVAASARHLPWHPTCLERSLALRRILAQRGLETELCIGVRKEGATLLAHAWLERGGEVVNDSPLTTATYARLVSSDEAYAAAVRLL